MNIENVTTPEGVQSVKPEEEVDVKDIKKIIGRYSIVWRNETKQIIRVEEILGDEFVYVLITGPDKGCRFQAKFYAKTIKVYDEDNLVLATVQ